MADFDPEDRTEADAMRAYLKNVSADPVVREALEVSSASLARELAKIEGGHEVPFSRLRRAVYAVTKYLLRMSYRPTPFGLMAGVAPVRFGDAPRFRRTGDGRKFVRPDWDWLLAVVMKLERRPEVLQHLLVMRNDFTSTRGDRLVLSYVRDVEDKPPADRMHEISVQYTVAVRRALELARRPVPYPELVEKLLQAFAGAPSEAIIGMLDQLIEREFLLTDLRPPQDSADALRHVIIRLAPLAGHLAERQLGEIHSAIDDYAQRVPGTGTPELRSLVNAMGRVHVAERPLQVDLRADVDVEIPKIVTRELVAAAAALWRVTPDPTPDHIREYHNAFVERFGYECAVPVKDLLDPERGLGAPATYLRPPSARQARPMPQSDPERLETLAALALDACRTGTREVVVDDRLIASLTREKGQEAASPPAFDMCASLLADSLDAVAEGDFRLVVLKGLGGPQPGTFFGRFLHVLGDTGREIAELNAQPHVWGPNAIPVQLQFQPNDSRSGNVSQVPRVLAHRLVMGAFPSQPDDHVLDLDDITIVADRHRFHVLSTSSGREIVPLLFHMLNPFTSQPNAARLLGEIAHLRQWPIRRWMWNGLDRLPYLPRVRYGRTILASARWLPDPRMLDKNLSWREWLSALRDWRQRWDVPELIEITTEDQRITVNLTVPLHQRVLWRELRAETTPTIMEPPAGGEYEAGWCDGRSNEIAVPLVPHPDAPRPSPAPAGTITARPRLHNPGGEWLYAKLYLSTEHHDELLADHLPAFLDRIEALTDRSFFIRFLDPDPHLRLRFHGDPSVLYGRLLPVLHEWVAGKCDEGVIRRMVLDTYEPEYVRYGGEKVLEFAERAFAADSRSTIAQLRMLRGGVLDIDPVVLAAANCVDICRRLSDDWTAWFLSFYRKERHHYGAFQSRRGVACRLIDPIGNWRGLAGVQGGDRLIAVWEERAAALADYGDALRAQLVLDEDGDRVTRSITSMLHMHCNRLLGIDAELEGSAYAVARGAVKAALDRERFVND